MPRGKNYVNNNKGMRLQPHRSKAGARENVDCIYGAGCSRKDCIYRHPPGGKNECLSAAKSKEPCMAFLAGFCTFTSGCTKRHPSQQECVRLRKKYKSISCRFGDDCKTNGCLYKHPSDAAEEAEEPVSYVMPDPQTLRQAEIRRQTQQQQMQYQRQMHLQMLQQQQIYQQQERFYQAQQQAMYQETYAQQFPPMGGGQQPFQPAATNAHIPPSKPPPPQSFPDAQSHPQTGMEATVSEELSADAKEWRPGAC